MHVTAALWVSSVKGGFVSDPRKAEARALMAHSPRGHYRSAVCGWSCLVRASLSRS